jgi:hypothetical protein
MMRYFFLGILCLLMSQDLMARNCCQQPPIQLQSWPCWWKHGWAATIFSGPLTSQTSSKIFRDADFAHSGIVALALSKEVATYLNNRLGFELETNAVQHFGDQKHFEFDPIAIIARWKAFPWNKTLPTTLAIGDGISIATQTPKLEVKRRGRDTSRVLNYVMAEATFSPPCYRQWAFILRYHHRSGLFGAFHGVHDASTAFAAGVKYWF